MEVMNQTEQEQIRFLVAFAHGQDIEELAQENAQSLQQVQAKMRAALNRIRTWY